MHRKWSDVTSCEPEVGMWHFRCPGRGQAALPVPRIGPAALLVCWKWAGGIFLFDSGTFCDLPSTSLVAKRLFFLHLSTICDAGKLSVNYHQLALWPKVILATFHVAGRPTVNFRELSVRPGELLSTSVHFPCSRGTFC